MVQARRTSSNLLEPPQCRAGKVCRGLSQDVGVVCAARLPWHRRAAERTRCVEFFHLSSVWVDGAEPARTYMGSKVCTAETRCAECSYTRSGWFKRSEPPRTVSNHFMTERGEVFPRRSGWFDCTEPSLTTSLQGKQGVQGARARFRGGSSAANLLEPSRTTAAQREQGV